MSKKGRIKGITVYPRGKKWAYIVYCEPDILTKERERIYEGGFDTEEDAFAAAIKAKTEAGGRKQQPPTELNVQQFLTEWLESLQDAIKPTTYANYVDNIDAYIVPIIGHHKLREVTVPVLNAFYRELLNSGRRKTDTNITMYEYWKARQSDRNGLGPGPTEVATACGTTIHAAKTAVLRYRRGRIPQPRPDGLAPKSVRNVHRLLHRALADAIGWEYITLNPAAHARLPRAAKNSKNRPTPWTLDELAAWLNVAMTDRFAGIWVLAATTGMRRSELAGAERDLLDLEAGVLIIEDTRVVVDGKAQDSDGKFDSSRRTISLDPFTTAALHTYLELLDKERAALGSAYPTHGKLMCFPNGRRLHPDTVTRRFNRLVDTAGVRHIRLHDIRHTYVTLARDHGMNGKILSDRVGHANESITQQVYTHRSSGHDREAATAIADLIQNALKGTS